MGIFDFTVPTLLEHLEQRKDQVIMDQDMVNAMNRLAHFGFDHGRIDEILRGFLNTAVQEARARSLFMLASRLEGFEAWRRDRERDPEDTRPYAIRQAREKMKDWPARAIDDVPAVLTRIETIVERVRRDQGHACNPHRGSDSGDLRACLPHELNTTPTTTQKIFDQRGELFLCLMSLRKM